MEDQLESLVEGRWVAPHGASSEPDAERGVVQGNRVHNAEQQDCRDGRNEPASQPISATGVVGEQAQRRDREDRWQRAEEHPARIGAQRKPKREQYVAPERSPAAPWRRTNGERGQPDPGLGEDLHCGSHEQPRIEQE